MKKLDRIWQLDFLKGIAIIAMVLFHYTFFLVYFNIIPFSENWFYWWLFPKLISGIFIIVSGILLWLSFYKDQDVMKQIRRSAIIFLAAMIVTITSYIVIPTDYILFGIMHFMALSGIIGYFILKSSVGLRTLIISGVLLIFIWPVDYIFQAKNDWLLWLGIMPYGYQSVDYFPLIPWFGLSLFGIALGKTIYEKGMPKIKKYGSENKIVNLFCFFGRNTLAIYMLHIPLLILIQYILSL